MSQPSKISDIEKPPLSAAAKSSRRMHLPRKPPSRSLTPTTANGARDSRNNAVARARAARSLTSGGVGGGAARDGRDGLRKNASLRGDFIASVRGGRGGIKIAFGEKR